MEKIGFVFYIKARFRRHLLIPGYDNTDKYIKIFSADLLCPKLYLKKMETTLQGKKKITEKYFFSPVPGVQNTWEKFLHCPWR